MKPSHLELNSALWISIQNPTDTIIERVRLFDYPVCFRTEDYGLSPLIVTCPSFASPGIFNSTRDISYGNLMLAVTEIPFALKGFVIPRMSKTEFEGNSISIETKDSNGTIIQMILDHTGKIDIAIEEQGLERVIEPSNKEGLHELNYESKPIKLIGKDGSTNYQFDRAMGYRNAFNNLWLGNLTTIIIGRIPAHSSFQLLMLQ